jgi:hypothetical protein
VLPSSSTQDWPVETVRVDSLPLAGFLRSEGDAKISTCGLGLAQFPGWVDTKVRPARTSLTASRRSRPIILLKTKPLAPAAIAASI